MMRESSTYANKYFTLDNIYNIKKMISSAIATTFYNRNNNIVNDGFADFTLNYITRNIADQQCSVTINLIDNQVYIDLKHYDQAGSNDFRVDIYNVLDKYIDKISLDSIYYNILSNYDITKNKSELDILRKIVSNPNEKRMLIGSLFPVTNITSTTDREIGISTYRIAIY